MYASRVYAKMDLTCLVLTEMKAYLTYYPEHYKPCLVWKFKRITFNCLGFEY